METWQPNPFKASARRNEATKEVASFVEKATGKIPNVLGKVLSTTNKRIDMLLELSVMNDLAAPIPQNTSADADDHARRTTDGETG